MIRRALGLLLFLGLFTGCNRNSLGEPSMFKAEETEVVELMSEETIEPSVSQLTLATPLATSPPISLPAPKSDIEVVTATATLLPQLSDEESDVSAILSKTMPPVRDDFRLARAYRGLVEDPELIDGSVGAPPEIGTRQIFKIMNVVQNTVGEIEAELLAVSDHAYFWFDTGLGSPQPEHVKLEKSAATFDEIYEIVVNYFGSEKNPGIDGDARLHVVNASPIALCGVTEETINECLLSGLVQPADLLPSAVDSRSNEREMFVMNSYRFGSDYYLGVLAHELRHMIEDNYDQSDTDWEKEGSATLSAQLAGFPIGAVDRGNIFLMNPDQQLNNWAEDNIASSYGQGYIMNRYIFDRLGSDLYRQFATNPLPGFAAIDSVAEGNDLNIDGETLWLDWLAALVLHNNQDAAEKYHFSSDGLNTATMTSVLDIPSTIKENVSQYGADYYQLPKDGVEVSFSGATEASLMDAAPRSGAWFWFAQRANNSNPRLTREVDLTNVDNATLSYQVFADIEYGYDFAYVSVSEDDGQTWFPLAGENMQGLDPEDNPAESAFSDRFYTGRTRQWLQENIDLTLYSGQKILLRFEYVTDPIRTFSGLAIDDISIPEIGFIDDVEQKDLSWMAEGFIRAKETLPQIWHLQLITFDGDTPNVQKLTTDEGGEIFLSRETLKSDREPILIIAASAPTTLIPADYELNIVP